MLTKAHCGWTLRVSEFTNLCLEEIFAKFPCRKQFPFAMRIYFPIDSFMFFAFLQPQYSWGLMHERRIIFQDCITETPTHCGPGRRHFLINLDQNAIFNVKNSGTTYANLELGMEIQWKTLARQRVDMGLHWHPIVCRRPTTKGSER